MKLRTRNMLLFTVLICVMTLKCVAVTCSMFYSFNAENTAVKFRPESRSKERTGSNNMNSRNDPKHGKEEYISGYQSHQFYNPVLKNYAIIQDYLNHRNKIIYYTRSKRILKPYRNLNYDNCSGFCERSLCPWATHWDDDEKRIPQFIAYAKCKSNECNFQYAGLNDVSNFKLKMYTNCEAITTDISVVKEGKALWLTDWPIACMCAKARVHTSAKTSGSELKATNNFTTSDTERVDANPLSPAQLRRLLIQLRHRQMYSKSFEEAKKQRKT